MPRFEMQISFKYSLRLRVRENDSEVFGNAVGEVFRQHCRFPPEFPALDAFDSRTI